MKAIDLPNNSTRQKPRNRSTNTAALSTAISAIKSNISPVIVTGRVSSHPKPLKANNEMWIPRTVRLSATQPSTSASTEFTTSAVFNNAGISGQVRILKIKAWNYTNSSASTNFIQLDTPVGLTETSVTTSVNDIGSSANLPGVMVKIPRTIASNLVTSLTDSLCTLKTTFQGNPSSPQSIVVDVQFEYKTDTNN